MSEKDYRVNGEGSIVLYDDQATYQRPDITEYRIDYAEVSAARSLVDIDATSGGVVQPEVEPGAPIVEVAKRMATIEQRFEFKPTSRLELNDTYDLTAKELIGGAAQQLNIVFNRQKRYMENPDRTVRAIVGRYRDYAKNAQAEAGFAELLRRQIEDSSAHVFARADSISNVSIWEDADSVARALVHVLRLRDSNALINVQEGDEAPDDDGLGKYALTDKKTQRRLKEMLDGNYRIRDLTSELSHGINQEKNRFEFWVQVLQESRNHNIARGIAHDALTELGAIKRV